MFSEKQLIFKRVKKGVFHVFEGRLKRISEGHYRTIRGKRVAIIKPDDKIQAIPLVYANEFQAFLDGWRQAKAA